MHLHIVSFNVPWPADYGGVIDVYYRIVALSKAGVHIHLHCYTYGRQRADELERWCDEVCYYPRETGIRHHLERRPYIVASRCSEALLLRLQQDSHPILLEGLHNCWLLEHLAGQGRRLIVRAHNVEHDYYAALAAVEKRHWKRLFFRTEARKLHRYETQLTKATTVLAISDTDAAHFRAIGCADVRLLPPSHGHTKVTSLIGRGDYVLYHGNLSVPENINAVHYLLEQVADRCPYQFIVAGRNPDEELQHAIAKHRNVRLLANPDDDTMHHLLREAQVNLLLTWQATGVKLKLMNALYEGRHCLVNSPMVEGTSLATACVVADTPSEILQSLAYLMKADFSEEKRQLRVAILELADPMHDIAATLLEQLDA